MTLSPVARSDFWPERRAYKGSLVVKDQLEALVTQMIERGLLFEEATSEFEKKFILKVLEKNHGNHTKAAKAMGIHRNTLNKKLAVYNHSRK
jgi:DNA-binding protein Fis